jgi:DNA replication protein DnaC
MKHRSPLPRPVHHRREFDREAHQGICRGGLEDKLKIYSAPRLLIIDEIGYLPFDRKGATCSSS